ncbi:MAG TPA: ribokinase [Pirellulales bacterium]|jgi:ribokinase
MTTGKSRLGIIVLGSINMDLVVQTPRMPAAGETVLGGRFFTSLGGKGANQAVAAARASRSPVTFVAAVGDDPFGREALELLGREPRLDTRAIRAIDGAATGVALITVDPRGENSICVASGANAQLSPADLDALPDETWRDAGVFVACLETPLATVAHGLRLARERGLLTILNPAPAVARAGSRELLQWVDVLTPNQLEAAALVQELTGEATQGTTDEIALAEQLRSAGTKRVIVTLGAEGCLIVDEQVVRAPAHRVTAVDTTAAGDAFNGALAVALAEGRRLADAARWASAAAAISVTRAGAIASLATREEIEPLFNA